MSPVGSLGDIQTEPQASGEDALLQHMIGVWTARSIPDLGFLQSYNVTSSLSLSLSKRSYNLRRSQADMSLVTLYPRSTQSSEGKRRGLEVQQLSEAVSLHQLCQLHAEPPDILLHPENIPRRDPRL